MIIIERLISITLVTAIYGQVLQITYKYTYTSVTLDPHAEKPHSGCVVDLYYPTSPSIMLLEEDMEQRMEV